MTAKVSAGDTKKDFDIIIRKMKKIADPKIKQKMMRFGISNKTALGISAPQIKEIGKEFKKRHDLAVLLWNSGIHEARLLASYIDDPAVLSAAEMERRVKQFDSWDICDAACMMVFDRTPHAFTKAYAWVKRKEEFVKRAGFVMMASIAVHHKKLDDEKLLPFFDEILKGADDERNFVRKAVNWALRQLGKRSQYLHTHALDTIKKLYALQNKTAAWIAKDAEKELTSPAVLNRLSVKADKNSIY